MVLALRAATTGRSRWIMWAGLIGAALFYGDGVITPSILVLSAVEGLKVATPAFEPYVVPLTLLLLVALFIVQRRGTGLVGAYFGPVMILWFTAIGVLGGFEIARRPSILLAVDPRHAVNLMLHHPWHGFVLLGSVVLAVTGAEALYADIGAFRALADPPRLDAVCVPGALVELFRAGRAAARQTRGDREPVFYFGAGLGALSAGGPRLDRHRHRLASGDLGAFSITRQAVQLGYLPRMLVRHTSEQEIGQVYVPALNGMLLVAVVATVIGFRSSDALGGAYGIAVTGTMTVTTVLAFVYFHWGAGWRLWRLVPLFALFLLVDLSFFGANLLKIIEGGWFPLAIAGTISPS